MSTYRVLLTAKYVQHKVHFLVPMFSGINTVNHGILDIAEAHILVMDKHSYVSMWAKISLTATETPLIETYLTMWNTRHGNKTDIHNE
jgi:molybdate-binding protein